MKKSLRSLNSRLTIRFKYWLLMVLASAILVGFPYMAVQQSHRQNANDPQVQYAQDIASALEQGASPEALGGSNPVDPRKSLGLFLILADDNKKVQANTMQLDGNDTPLPPNGAFDAAKKGKQQRITWQAHKDARVALVMQHYKGAKQSGYVMVGRSMKEVEKREQQLMLMAVGAFLALLAVATIAVRIGTVPAKTTPKAVASPEPLAFEEETKTTEAEEKPAETKSAAKSSAHKTSKHKKSGKKSTRS